MKDFHPYFTGDGSVGLYSERYNDIFHSASGALTESYEKFILPVDFANLMKKDSIKVLDICYGIGYNSKSFLNFIFENFSQKKFCPKKFSLKNFSKNSSHAKSNLESIYTNNIFITNEEICNGEIYNDNIFSKISVTAVDNDKFLSFLSPFFITGKKNIKRQKLDFDYKKIEKYLQKPQPKNLPKISNLINFVIFDKIAQKYPEILSNSEIESILTDTKYAQFTEDNLKGILRYYQNNLHKTNHSMSKLAFLHNIYYRHITNCYKKSVKRYKLQDFNFDLKIGDARQVIKNDKNMYNLIFLDAFTPEKCPCLWSYEFFKLLYEHLESDGMILTYSTSAAVRGAMIEAGFEIGGGDVRGTIAAKNKNLIKFPLSEFDLGLIKTRAGIFYHDENLTDPNEAISARRNNEIKNSDRLSSSKYRNIK